MWGIGVKGDPVNMDHVHTEIVPIHKNHDDAEVTLIPENHVNVGTVHIHVHAGMLTGVWIPQRSDVPTTQLWTL